MVGLLLWITHCWCCVFLMCNARALKPGVAALNVALKLRAPSTLWSEVTVLINADHYIEG